MNVLLADDDPLARATVGVALRDWGFEVIDCVDGVEAWDHLSRPGGPRLALLDWLMPGMDGPEICRRARTEPGLHSAYLILLTARGGRDAMIEGLTAGADDYVAKPFDRDELRLRVRAGERIVNLQGTLADRVAQLEGAATRVRAPQRILPICSYCKKVRNDRDCWEQVEEFIATQIDVRFSHGICPDCFEEKVKPELEQLRRSERVEPDPP